jgi:PhnB protein
MKTQTAFAPLLYIPGGVTDISFYEKALGAIEHYRFTNDDGSIHVAELSIDGVIFHVHEENHAKGVFCPDAAGGTTTIIGLFVDDVQALMNKALAGGAVELSPVTDYDYGYRQGEIKDHFGHHWCFQKRI